MIETCLGFRRSMWGEECTRNSHQEDLVFSVLKLLLWACRLRAAVEPFWWGLLWWSPFLNREAEEDESLKRITVTSRRDWNDEPASAVKLITAHYSYCLRTYSTSSLLFPFGENRSRTLRTVLTVESEAISPLAGQQRIPLSRILILVSSAFWKLLKKIYVSSTTCGWFVALDDRRTWRLISE